MAVPPVRGGEPVQTKLVFDISFVDWPVDPPASAIQRQAAAQRLAKATWGEQGLEMAMDTVLGRRVEADSLSRTCRRPLLAHQGRRRSRLGHHGIRSIHPSPAWTVWSQRSRRGTWWSRRSKRPIARALRSSAWFDLTEGHAGLPTKWALDHPQFCMVDRKGIRLDGPLGLVSRNGVRLDRAHAESMDLRDADCREVSWPLIASGRTAPASIRSFRSPIPKSSNIGSR